MSDQRLDLIGKPCAHGQPPGACKDCRIAALTAERDALRESISEALRNLRKLDYDDGSRLGFAVGILSHALEGKP